MVVGLIIADKDGCVVESHEPIVTIELRNPRTAKILNARSWYLALLSRRSDFTSTKSVAPKQALSLRSLSPFRRSLAEHIRAVVDSLFVVRSFCLLTLVEAGPHVVPIALGCGL